VALVVTVPVALVARDQFPAAVAAVVVAAPEPVALEQEDKFGWYHGKQLGNDPR
jgi:hypothetical protein